MFRAILATGYGITCNVDVKEAKAVIDINCENAVCAIANGVCKSLLADVRQIVDTAHANAVGSGKLGALKRLII